MASIINALFNNNTNDLDEQSAREVAPYDDSVIDLGLYTDPAPKKVRRQGGALRGSAYLTANPAPAHDLTSQEIQIKELIEQCEKIQFDLELAQEALADAALALTANLLDKIEPFVCVFDTTGNKPFDVANGPARRHTGEAFTYEQFAGIDALAHVGNVEIDRDDVFCEIFPFQWIGKDADLKTTHAWPPSLEGMRQANGYKVCKDPAPAPRPFLLKLGVKGAQIEEWTKNGRQGAHPLVARAREFDSAFVGDSGAALKTIIRFGLKDITDLINAPVVARHDNKRWLMEYAGATDGAKWPRATNSPRAAKPSEPAEPAAPDMGVEIEGM